jgi:putative ABC transport system substrate-binding protein
MRRDGIVKRIGILETAAPDAARLALWELFRRSLEQCAPELSREAAFEFCWAGGHTDRLAGLAAALVADDVDVLVTAGTPAAAAASRATADIPIVMATGVGLGTKLGDTHERQNANVTGISDLPPGVSAARLRWLRDAVSAAAPLAILADRGNPSSPLAVDETQAAARDLGLTVKDYWIEHAGQFGEALLAMRRDGVPGFLVAPGALFFAQRQSLATLALQHCLLSMTVRREYAEAGCLMAYGAPIRDNYRQAADYVARILGGKKPADLAIAEPTEFDFVVNAKTADALGIAMPTVILARAELLR